MCWREKRFSFFTESLKEFLMQLTTQFFALLHYNSKIPSYEGGGVFHYFMSNVSRSQWIWIQGVSIVDPLILGRNELGPVVNTHLDPCGSVFKKTI